MAGARKGLVALAAIVAVSGAGLAAYSFRPDPPAAPALPSGFERLGRGAEDAMVRSADGATVRWGDLAGRPRALFFGFTHCPDICPTTVAELDAARARLGSRARSLQIDFVTVDPERDTPAQLARYFSSFEGVRAFAGDAAATAQIANAYRVSYTRSAGDGPDYTMDHTASVYLIGRDGQVVDRLPFGAPPEVVDAKLRQLLQGRRGTTS